MAQTERCTASQATLFRCFRRSSQCRDLPRHSGAECIPQISRFLTQKSKICVIWGIEDLFAAAWMRYGMARGMKRGHRGTPFAALKENPVSLEERCFAAKPRQLGGALPGFRFKAPGSRRLSLRPCFQLQGGTAVGDTVAVPFRLACHQLGGEAVVWDAATAPIPIVRERRVRANGLAVRQKSGEPRMPRATGLAGACGMRFGAAYRYT